MTEIGEWKVNKELGWSESEIWWQKDKPNQKQDGPCRMYIKITPMITGGLMVKFREKDPEVVK